MNSFLATAQVQCKRSLLTAAKSIHQLAASTHSLPTYTVNYSINIVSSVCNSYELVSHVNVLSYYCLQSVSNMLFENIPHVSSVRLPCFPVCNTAKS